MSTVFTQAPLKMGVRKILFCIIIAFESVLCAYPDSNGYATGTSAERNCSVVSIKTQGLVRGRRAQDGNYCQYTGIPYATASKENRFKNQLPVPKWEGIREANSEYVVCAQYNKTIDKVVGTEDCLVLNVYTPERTDSSTKLPVMVFIHGGGWNMGSGDRRVFSPKLFVEENVILVTFNYRLGLLGFLCTGNIANDGLKDALEVLKWIQENIKAFGGNPDEVTIFGQSAGSAMVELLMLSKTAKGLFTCAISQSGVTALPWAFGSDPEAKVRRVTKLLGYEGNDADERLRILKNASVEDLIRTQEKLFLMTPYEFLPLTPCIEPKTNPGAIVTEEPNKIIRSGRYNDIPYVLGFTEDEELLLYALFGDFPNFLDSLNTNFKYTLPKDLQSLKDADEIARIVKKWYFGDEKITMNSMPKAVPYFTDVNYALGTIQMARLYLKSGKKFPMHMYEFAYDGGISYNKKILNITNIKGVLHEDDLGYMLPREGYDLVRADDILTARRLVKLWTNFAKYKNPTPNTTALLPVKWTRVTENLDYLLIDRDLQMSRMPFPNRIMFWDALYRQFAPKE